MAQGLTQAYTENPQTPGFTYITTATSIVIRPACLSFARTGNICCGNIFCFRETKNVSDFFQKHFVFSTNVSPFARRGNNVSATVFPQQCFLVCGGLYSEASFNLTRIAVSGDVFVNPVPAATGNASVKCPICWKTIANH